MSEPYCCQVWESDNRDISTVCASTPINYFLWLTQLSEWNVNKIKQCLDRWPCCCSRSNEQSGSFFIGREKFRGEFDVTATLCGSFYQNGKPFFIGGETLAIIYATWSSLPWVPHPRFRVKVYGGCGKRERGR